MILTKKNGKNKIKVYSSLGKGLINKKLSPHPQSEFVVPNEKELNLNDFKEE